MPLIQYGTIPARTASDRWSVTVDGTPVVTDRIGISHLARFAFRGTVTVVVTRTGGAAAGTSVRPSRYGITPSITSSTVTFTLSHPRKLQLRLSGEENLFICADAPEVAPRSATDANTINLGSRLSPSRDTSVAVTSIFQTALNDTAALNAGAGGILFVPNGLYMSAQLTIPSNVEMYLESGAQVRCITDTSGSNFPDQNGADSSFIYAFNATNFKITGRGVIDGNGRAIDTAGGNDGANSIKLVRFTNCSDWSMEGIYLRDSARFTINPVNSSDFSIVDTKCINDVTTSGTNAFFMNNTDGFDPDMCRNVVYRNNLMVTCDDAVSPKTARYQGQVGTASNIDVLDNVFWTYKCGTKIGTELFESTTEVDVYGNTYLLCDRILAIWNDPTVAASPSPNHSVTAVRVANNAAEEFYADGSNKTPIMIRCLTEASLVDNVIVNGLHMAVDNTNSSRIGDSAGFPLVSNVAFRNFYRAGVALTSAVDTAAPRAANVFGLQFRAPTGQTNHSNVTFQAPGADGLPTVNVLATDPVAMETDGSIGIDTGTFTVSRAGDLTSALTVLYSVSGTATPGTDYVALSGSVTIPAGAYEATIVVSPSATADADEGTETVTVTLTANAAYQLGTFTSDTVNIYNATAGAVLPVVTVTATDATAQEASPATDTGTFTVTRTGATTSALTVLYGVTGTATNGTDYTTLSGSVSIPIGASTATVTVTPILDGNTDPNETVTLTITPNAAYTVGSPSSDTVTILDAAPSSLPFVSVSLQDGSASEARSPTNPGRYQITRTGVTTAELVVSIAMSGSATNGTDYATIPSTVIIPAGASRVFVALNPIPDSLAEGTETATLTIQANAAYQIGTAAATVNILNV